MSVSIPENFLKWLASSRLRLLEEMEQGRQVRFFPAHLPVLASWSDEERFPVNLSVKGIGLIPKDRLLSEFTALCEDVFEKARDREWGESLSERREVLRSIYRDPAHFDPSLLGGLEIFEGRTLSNLRANPLVSLLFLGMLPRPERVEYLSFQVNGEVKTVGREDPRYRYLLAARRLFEFDRFHLPQDDYPLGYVIRVDEVLDKSPFIRNKE
jgi:hypothetical protein